MDPLSLATGIAGLIKVTLVLTQTAISIINDVSSYPQEVTTLIKSTKQIYDLIYKIGRTITEHEGETSGVVTEVQIRACETTLQNILATLTKCIIRKGDKLGNTIKSIAWTMKHKAELRGLMQELEQHKSTFSLALTGDLHLDYKSRHNDIQCKRAKNSGQWILTNKRFEDWVHNENSNTLYCLGPAGVGKSFLTSCVIDHLESLFQRQNVGVAYFYCDYQQQDSNSQTATAILANLLRQLAMRSDSLDKDLEKVYDLATGTDSYRNIRPLEDPNILKKLLKSVSQSFDVCYLILDALDESGNGQKDILETMNDLCGEETRFKGFATSRPHSKYIQNVCNQSSSTIDITADELDIENFIEQKLMADDFVTPDLRKLITKKLIENAQGSFLLVNLQLQHVLKQTFPQQRKKALKTLPKSPDETYTRIMERTQRRETGYKDIVIPALSFLLYAKRPILMDELSEALAVNATLEAAAEVNHEDRGSNGGNSDECGCNSDGSDNDFSVLDDDYGDCKDLPSYLPSALQIIELCEGLLIHEPSSGIVRFSHYTVAHFLKARQTSLELLTEVTLGKICVTYLLFDVFGQGPSKNQVTLRQRKREYKLVAYAAQFWGAHTKGEGEKDTMLKSLVLQLLGSKTKREAMIEMAENAIRAPYFPNIEGCSMLHIIAINGLSALYCSLLHAKNFDGSSAVSHLDVEIPGVSSDILNFLLEEMTDVNAGNVFGWTALHQAVLNGHLDMVLALLDIGGASVSVHSKPLWTVLHLASQHGHEHIVEALLHHNADVSVRHVTGRTALNFASEQGHWSIVKRLAEAVFLKEGNTSKISQSQRDLIANLNAKVDTRVNQLSKLVKIFPDDYHSRVSLFRELWKNRLHKAAAEEYEHSLLLDPVNSFACSLEEMQHNLGWCDNCEQKLVGIRRRCITCADFDLCGDCFIKPDARCDLDHQFLELPSANWKPWYRART